MDQSGDRLWLIAAPFVLGFSSQAGPLWNHIVIGLVVAGDALWAAWPRPREHAHHA